MLKISSSRIEATIGGYAALANLHNDLLGKAAGEITVDFSTVSWMDAHMASGLRVIACHADSRGQSIRIYGMDPRISTILRKNGFLAGPLSDTYATTMPSTLFQLDEGVSFAEYARRHLSHPSMPKMTVPLQRKFFEGIDEIFANCSLHSRSVHPISVCGQFFPKRRQLGFSISDGGQGILASYVQWANTPSTACDAIDWAMQRNNTTRIGDIPGGLGLAVIRDFVRLNRGRLVVASDKGYWRQDGGQITSADMKNAFPGTSISMEIDCSDTTQYDLTAEANPNDIW